MTIFPTKVNCFYADNKINGLHLTTRYTLLICRCLGVFPVSGLMNLDDKKLRLKIKSPYILICIVSLIGQFMATFLSLSNLMIYDNHYNKFVINATGLTSTLLILSLARHWPQLVQEVAVIERSLPRISQRNLATLCNITAALVFLATLVDSCLAVAFYLRVAEDCYENVPKLESFYKYTMPWATEYLSYKPWATVLLQMLFIQIVFVGNFTDVLIMVISLYLTHFFEHLNELVVLYKDKYPGMWGILRTHYTKLMHLVNLVDDKISSLVLFSFGSNLALICGQLYKIFRNDLGHNFSQCNEEKLRSTAASTERISYLTFSIIFIITRALLTALLAARLPIAARAPMAVLHDIPTCCYSKEAHRFLCQIHMSTITLSGLQFFYVTRKMILAMAATIVTYELVLLQLADKSWLTSLSQVKT